MSSSGCGKRKEKNNRETIEKLDPDGIGVERKKEEEEKKEMNQNKENRKTDLWLGPTEQPPSVAGTQSIT